MTGVDVRLSQTGLVEMKNERIGKRRQLVILFVVGCIVGAPTLRYRDATTPSFDAALPGLSHFLVAVPVLLLRRCWLSQYADSGLSIAAPARRAAPPPINPGPGTFTRLA